MNAALDSHQERRLLWGMALLQLTLLLDFMIIMPLGPELMRLLGVSAAEFGAIVSAYTLASAIMGLLGVFWLDRWDRKRTLLLLYAGFIASTLACGVATSPLSLLAARILAGICAGPLWAVLLAIVVDLVPEERRGSAIGTVMTSYGLSAVGGVPLGLFLANQWGWRAPFFALSALSLILWLAALAILPALRGHIDAPRESSKGSFAPLFSPGLMLGWGLTFCVVFAGFLLIPYLSAFMVGNLGRRLSELPWVYLCGGAATLVTSRLIGSLVDSLRPSRVLAFLLFATMVPHLLFTHLSPSPLPVVMGAFVLFMTLNSGRVIPTIALITSRVPPELRGRYMAVNTAASDSASGLAAWTSGLMITSGPDGALIGFGKMGWVAVCVTLVALSVLWFLERQPRMEQRDDAPEPGSA